MRKAREDKGLSTLDLESLTEKAGQKLSNQSISNIETGKTNLNDPRARRSVLLLARLLESDFDETWVRDALTLENRKAIKEFRRQSPDSKVVELSILAKIAAGGFSDVEVTGEFIELPRWLLKKNKKCFAAYIQGDSMRDAGVFHKDIVILTETKEPHNHDTVVVETDEGATIKEWILKGDAVELRPRNSDYDKAGSCTPISVRRIALSDVRRVHEVIALIRLMR